MDLPSATFPGAGNALSHEESSTTTARLQGVPLLVARGLWGILVVGAISLFVMSLPLYYTSLLNACIDSSNPICTIHGMLTNSGMQELRNAGIAPTMYATYTIVLSLVGACIWSGIGLWVFWRRSDDWMALFVSYFLISYSTNVSAGPTVLLVQLSPAWGLIATLVSLWAVSSLGLFFCLFPDGRFTPRWTGWLAAGYILLQILSLFPPFKSFFSTGTQTIWFTHFIFVGLLCALIFAQINRYRQFKQQVQRQQTKWVVFGSAAAIIGLLLADVPYLITSPLTRPGVLELTLNSVFYLVTLPIPLSIGIAMARYRLYDIDVLINRTLIYGTLSGLLALIYVSLVIALQAVFQSFSGGSQFTVIVSTLAIAALFRHLRILVQQNINRRFYRSRYDAARILTAFSTAIRREIDLNRLSEQLVTIVTQTLLPTRTTVHYAEGQRDDPLLDYLTHNPDAVEPKSLPAASPAVQALHKESVALVVPLMSQSDLVGWLALGRRRGGQGYSTDDRRLLNTLASQIAPAIQVAQLVQERQATALEQERVEQELRVAQRIQHSLLPKAIPALPNWQIAVSYQPAREVSGDFYDFFPFADGRLGLIIGDVSGKGVPAALVMATTRSILHAVVQADIPPGTVLARTNNTLQPDIPPGMFVTCFYAIINPATGHVHYANAGHDLPYRYGHGNAAELEARGMPLGLMPDMEYEEQEVTLQTGEGVVFHSDGLVEAHNPARAMFGFPRMMQLLSAYSANMDVIQLLLEQLHIFTGPHWVQEDDITLVTLHRDEEHEGRTVDEG